MLFQISFQSPFGESCAARPDQQAALRRGGGDGHARIRETLERERLRSLRPDHMCDLVVAGRLPSQAQMPIEDLGTTVGRAFSVGATLACTSCSRRRAPWRYWHRKAESTRRSRSRAEAPIRRRYRRLRMACAAPSRPLPICGRLQSTSSAGKAAAMTVTRLRPQLLTNAANWFIASENPQQVPTRFHGKPVSTQPRSHSNSVQQTARTRRVPDLPATAFAPARRRARERQRATPRARRRPRRSQRAAASRRPRRPTATRWRPNRFRRRSSPTRRTSREQSRPAAVACGPPAAPARRS